MARARSPNRDKSREIYLNSKGSVKLKDIAAELGVKDSQIRKWKSQDKWDDELKGALPKVKSNVTNKKATKKEQKKKEAKQEIIIDDIDIENNNFTEKQRLFCLYYIKSFNATMSAIKAGYSKESAHVQGSRLLSNVKIKAEIRKLKGAMAQELFIDAMDVVNKYVKIAFADITDYADFGNEEVTKIDKETNKENKYIKNFFHLKDSSMVDGTIISEVRQGKEGVSIKLLDQMKALEKLEKYFDLFPDKFRREIEEQKLKLSKEKLEIEKTIKTKENVETKPEVLNDSELDDLLEDDIDD
ncbi:terminase small subunit [Tepidibacter hydrothermalis]|uniref:Terminase small subunit n=1 Tax=Tepidibacter hydrothermalis TaxID=3036126 RepID=A0ABY8EHM7_9FIRM|nr:terminase small subunit [Tepidibacter hydrothermalis]WFD12423.1 terminase small subunit [Tepidibacter hydrothermalis]